MYTCKCHGERGNIGRPRLNDTRRNLTRHNSADSVLTSNVCVKEGATRTTFSHVIYIAGIIYYTCSSAC